MATLFILLLTNLGGMTRETRFATGLGTVRTETRGLGLEGESSREGSTIETFLADMSHSRHYSTLTTRYSNEVGQLPEP